MNDMANWTRPEPGSGRVLFPPDVDARESLMGLVFKAASDNVHSNVGGLLADAGYPHARAFDIALARPQALPGLARVLGVPIDLVAKLTHPEVRRVRAVRTVRFLDAEIPDYDVVTIRRRISPMSLAEVPFHRAVWNHGLLPYCPHSLQLLVENCPACGRRLGWYRAGGLSGCDSRSCEADVGAATPVVLDRSVVPAYRRMAALAAPRDATARTRLHPELATLDTGAAFELGWRLACAINGISTPRKEAHRLPAATIVATLAKADAVLTEWPGRLRGDLCAHLAENGAEAVLNSLRLLRHAVAANAGWPAITALVRRSYPDLLSPGRIVLRSLDDRIITGTRANALVRMSATRFAAIKRSRELPAVASTGSARSFADFDREVIGDLAEAKRGSVPTRVVSERFGIAQHGVEQLACLGLLEREAHPALVAFAPEIRVTIRSLEALEKAIAAARNDTADYELPLRIAVKALGGEKPWGPIVQELLGGALPYRLPPGRGRLFGRILVPSAAVEVIRRLAFDREDHPDFAFAADMTRRDALEAMNLNPAQLEKAFAEELGSRSDVRRVLVEDVARISRELISPAEISARTAPGSRLLPAVLREGSVRRKGVAGWRRFEVQHLL